MATVTSGDHFSPLSFGSIPSDRLKNLRDVEKCSSLSLCLPVRRMSLTTALGVHVLVHLELVLSLFDSCSKGDTALSVDTIQSLKSLIIQKEISYKYNIQNPVSTGERHRLPLIVRSWVQKSVVTEGVKDYTLT